MGTYIRGRFARAARLMRGLGCAVAADKREVPVFVSIILASLIKETEKMEHKTGRKNSVSHPATLAGLFMQLFPRTPAVHPKYIQMISYGTPQLSVPFSTHHVRAVSLKLGTRIFLHAPFVRMLHNLHRILQSLSWADAGGLAHQFLI